MCLKLFRLIGLTVLIMVMTSCNFNIENEATNKNLINKVNAIDNQWVNYDGLIEKDNTMVQSQFIPYSAGKEYKLNKDAYVSYYKGGNFITTELHDDESELEIIEAADGVILSFNKGNKSGMQLTQID